jgi:hypothetical protein
MLQFAKLIFAVEINSAYIESYISYIYNHIYVQNAWAPRFVCFNKTDQAAAELKGRDEIPLLLEGQK